LHRSQEEERVIMATPGGSENAIDTDLGERYYQNDETLELKIISEIAAVVVGYVERRFKEGRRPALRNAHAMDTGCVKAIFRVNKNLPPELRQGVFSKEQDYDAWIRFSHANPEITTPRWPGGRGMAVKLIGIEGPKLLDETDSQDFIMINQPSFFINEPQHYLNALTVFHSGGFAKQLWSLTTMNWSERLRASKTNFSWLANPLFAQYWSTTAYRLGAKDGPKTAIKFSAKPRLASTPSFIGKWSTILRPGFNLKNELAKTIAKSEMSFDFYIQRFRSLDSTPVEDATVEWTEDAARLEPVAQIIIPRQEVLSEERNRFCENLSFNPWHALPEHKPLGVTNRIRRRIYLDSKKCRYRLNKIT
jgi:catalase